MRRRVPSLALALLVAPLGACAHGISLTTGSSSPPDPALLMSCARSIATDQGLGVISQPPGQYEMQAKSVVETPTTPDRAAAPSYDVLTVKLSPAKEGFRMLVGSASYVLRQLRGVTTGGSSAGGSKAEWVGTSPSTRVALARDAVLTKCGSLGN
jgi:hypothetical protein